MVVDEQARFRSGLCVDWCPTECLTSLDLAIVADG
jgi:formate hydrogenlyase subunit 6/NADH:ubiquinone oxidoreductase subunit I